MKVEIKLKISRLRKFYSVDRKVQKSTISIFGIEIK